MTTLISWYIDWNLNLNVFNWFAMPSQEDIDKIITNMSKIFQKEVSINFVEYNTQADIDKEVARQIDLKKEIEFKNSKENFTLLKQSQWQ